MAVRSSANELVSIGPETTPGVAVPTTRTLGALNITATPEPNVKLSKAKGRKFATAATLISETTKYAMDGDATYDELIYPLAGIACVPTITTPGGATLTRQWDFRIDPSNPDTVQTYSFETGSNARNTAGTWLQLTEFGITSGRQDVLKLSGAAIGQALLDDKVRTLVVLGASGGTFTISIGAGTTASIAYNAAASAVQSAIRAVAGNSNVTVVGTSLALGLRADFSADYANVEVPTLSVSSSLTGTSPSVTLTRVNPSAAQLALQTISPVGLDYYVSTSSYSNLISGGIHLTNTFGFDWKIANRAAAYMPVNSANGVGFAGVTESEMTSEVKLTPEAGVEGATFWRSLRSGSRIWMRAVATGALIESGFNYLYDHRCCLYIKNISEPKDVDGSVMGYEVSAEFAYDPTWGNASTWTLRNTLTAL